MLIKVVDTILSDSTLFFSAIMILTGVPLFFLIRNVRAPHDDDDVDFDGG